MSYTIYIDYVENVFIKYSRVYFLLSDEYSTYHLIIFSISIYILIINYFNIIIIYLKYKRVVLDYIIFNTFLNVIQNYCSIISVVYKKL